MGLPNDDPVPTEITLRDAYSKIREWYQGHAGRDSNPHAEASLPLIDALPAADQLSELEIRAVLAEVIMGKLEWGYHQSDGEYKMAAYAHSALDSAGYDFRLTGEEVKGLRESNSSLVPLLSEHILGT